MAGHYERLAIDHPDGLLPGRAPRPVTTRRGLVIGGGRVYPELNFTLSNLQIEASSMAEVGRQYHQVVTDALKRAVELEVPGLVIEFETLPPMTEYPDWGMQVVTILLDAIEDAHAKHGLPCTLRMTPNDNREFIRPPVMRSGRYWDAMVELFDRSAAAGAELLSIESVGGKELHDEALFMGDLRQVIFALCIAGVNDMRFLWNNICDIAQRHGVHAAGDTACGFANTAMVMAHQKLIPSVFTAVVRAVSAVRSLVAYEQGAVGPGKDCGYENIYLKAITGCPMSHEGKSATCAHLSPIGNVAAAACDLWSNESVQNVRLLGGLAPTCMLESLAYDCRLFNESSRQGEAAVRQLRDWLVASDAKLNPQAYLLTPANAIRIARQIVGAANPYLAGRAVALEAIEILTRGMQSREVAIAERERPWLDALRQTVTEMPDDEDRFIESMLTSFDRTRFLPHEYDLEHLTA